MDDRASILTMEAFLAAVIIVGAGASAVALMPRDTSGEPGWRDATSDANDAMQMLDLQRIGGVRALDLAILDGVRCGGRAAECAATPSAARIASLLAEDASYRLVLSNGVGKRTLLGDAMPPASAVGAGALAAPRWNHTFAAALLSCQDLAAPIELRAMPLASGSVARVPSLAFSQSGLTLPAALNASGQWSASAAPGLWSVAPLGVTASARGDSFPGEVSVGVCLLGAPTGNALLNGTRASTLTIAPAPPGGRALLSYDLAPLFARVPSATLRSVTIDVYDPAPAAAGSQPRAAATLATPGTRAGTAAWEVPADALYGTHPALLRAQLDVPTALGPVSVEARVLGALPVTLPDGRAPAEAVYRVSLQVWRAEWT